MSIRDVINTVPAKPIITTAVALTIVAAVWHGVNTYRTCTARAHLTAGLHGWAERTLAGDAAVRLDSTAKFAWDEVRISQGLQEPPPAPNCPFGWHWSNAERQAMARAGNLTAIGFFKGGRVVEIADFDRRRAQFDVTGEAIRRTEASFRRGAGRQTLRAERTP